MKKPEVVLEGRTVTIQYGEQPVIVRETVLFCEEHARWLAHDIRTAIDVAEQCGRESTLVGAHKPPPGRAFPEQAVSDCLDGTIKKFHELTGQKSFTIVWLGGCAVVTLP